MESIPWFKREFRFGQPPGMLTFFLERLCYTGLRIENKVTAVPEEWLVKSLNNKWTIKQHIGHLAEVDQIALKRLDEMISGIPQLSPAVFEPQQDYNALPVSEVVAYFKDQRARNLKRYRGLSEIDLQKSSLHPRLKIMMNPVDLAMFDAEHDDHHLVKINEIINHYAYPNKLK